VSNRGCGPGSGQAAISLSPAIAKRRLIEGAFLEELMESAPGVDSAQAGRFARIAYLNYNAVNQQYEYFSIDSRAPQMMNERSANQDFSGRAKDEVLNMFGGSFVAPQWGDVKNAAFMYRLTIGVVENDRQVVRLYLTPQSAQAGREFLAFEYVYTRQH
jgi:hypothetical protein